MNFAIGIDEIREAAGRIRPHVIRTPLIYSERVSAIAGCGIWFKAENLQHIGAFKSRGACNAVFSLNEAEAKCGVVTHSSGNHAAALARAASRRVIRANVVMPKNSSSNKIAAVRSWGVEPVFCEPTAQSREETATRIQQETGATMIHPYNNPAVMAGQGTAGLEILQDLENVDTIVVPVGGGGLLSGLLVAVKSLRPEIRVIAAEPVLADDAARSLQSGRIEMPIRYDTIADGLRTPLGSLTFPIIKSLLDEIILVDEATISRATRTIAELAKLVAEPSGAVALGAVLQRPGVFSGRNVVTVISGGNIEFGNCALGSAGT